MQKQCENLITLPSTIETLTWSLIGPIWKTPNYTKDTRHTPSTDNAAGSSWNIRQDLHSVAWHCCRYVSRWWNDTLTLE